MRVLPLVLALVAIAFALVAVSLPANAACRKSNVCDAFNMNCKVVDVCDSRLDLPSVGLPPPPSVRMPGLKPLPSVRFPPLGTTRCSQKVVNGRWQRVCK